MTSDASCRRPSLRQQRSSLQDAYGQQVILAADSVTVKFLSAYANNIGFTGRYLDGESGLWYFRTRQYYSALGRFIGRDKYGYIDGMSLYNAYFIPSLLDPYGNDNKAPPPWPPPGKNLSADPAQSCKSFCSPRGVKSITPTGNTEPYIRGDLVKKDVDSAWTQTSSSSFGLGVQVGPLRGNLGGNISQIVFGKADVYNLYTGTLVQWYCNCDCWNPFDTANFYVPTNEQGPVPALFNERPNPGGTTTTGVSPGGSVNVPGGSIKF